MEVTGFPGEVKWVGEEEEEEEGKEEGEEEEEGGTEDWGKEGVLPRYGIVGVVVEVEDKEAKGVRGQRTAAPARLAACSRSRRAARSWSVCASMCSCSSVRNTPHDFACPF